LYTPLDCSTSIDPYCWFITCYYIICITCHPLYCTFKLHFVTNFMMWVLYFKRTLWSCVLRHGIIFPLRHGSILHPPSYYHEIPCRSVHWLCPAYFGIPYTLLHSLTHYYTPPHIKRITIPLILCMTSYVSIYIDYIMHIWNSAHTGFQDFLSRQSPRLPRGQGELSLDMYCPWICTYIHNIKRFSELWIYTYFTCTFCSNIYLDIQCIISICRYI